MKKYTAWTRSSETDRWIQTNITATSKREAAIKLKDLGREIERGSLKVSKNQIG